MTKCALVHDYITQKGGAERVVLALADAFPEAPIYTSLYNPETTFGEFAEKDIRPLAVNRAGVLRRNHRLALPLLAPSFSGLRVDADIVVCSSSGWAHGLRTDGKKVVYCHAPARWLYQSSRYLDGGSAGTRAALSVIAPWLRAWDKRAAQSADRYVVNSRAIQSLVASVYGIHAEVIPPPVAISVEGEERSVDGVEPGFILCVSRLMSYKNVDAIVRAFDALPGARLVVAGDGPERARLVAMAGPNVKLLGKVDDAVLRWLYRSCIGLVSASYEDFGLTPVEAAAHGKPSAVLRFGGFLDTTVEGLTGVFFDRPEHDDIAAAILELAVIEWNDALLRKHAKTFSAEEFIERMRLLVDAELALGA
jgi:glycosyltransferase involved in cell wall biosynthesis